MNSTKNIKKELKLHIERNEQVRLDHNELIYNYGYMTKIIADKVDIPRFIDALAVFIK